MLVVRVRINRVETDGKITLQESAGMAIVTIHRPDYKNATNSIRSFIYVYPHKYLHAQKIINSLIRKKFTYNST